MARKLFIYGDDYAICSVKHIGNTVRYPRRDDKPSAISMPVLKDSAVACCANLFWPQAITEELGGIDAMAKILSKVTRRIETRLDESG